MGAGNLTGCFGCRAASIVHRVIVANARSTWDADFFAYGFVAWHFFLDDFDHAAFAALGITRGDNFFPNDVIVACFHLAGFGAVAGTLVREAEHRAAG